MDITHDTAKEPNTDRLGLKLKDWLPEDMPRERMRDHGPSALTASELIAILLRSGTSKLNVKDLAQLLLREFEGLEGLSKTTMHALTNLNGIGEAKAAQVMAAMEISRRIRMGASDAGSGDQTVAIKHGTDMTKPAMVADLMGPLLIDAPQEELWVIYLNKRRRYRGKSCIYRGTCEHIGIRPNEIMAGVIERRLPGFLVVHNHPSEESQPSSADILATKKMVKAANALDLEMQDHIVIAKKGFTSMRHSRLVDFS